MQNVMDGNGTSPADADVWFAHLRPLRLDDRDAILFATQDIEMAFTGRVDMLPLNDFFAEASKELRNAVRLFEEGIYDAAFYSVRSAVELAHIVTYFSGEDDPISNDLHDRWVAGARFPQDGSIRRDLSKICAPYQEVKQALPRFFEERQDILGRANKYIHRQGYRTFYARGQFAGQQRERDLNRICCDFHSFITGAVTEIILLRLSVDPFPLLLRDPDVMYRIHYIPMTKPLSDEVVEKFLTPQLIDSYRSTEFYSQQAAMFSDNEPFSKAAYDLFNFKIYHRAEHEEITRQAHLLEESDRMAVRIFECAPEVSCMISDSGISMYKTDSFDFRKGMPPDFGPDRGQPGFINRSCEQGYESLMRIGGKEYALIHVRSLSAESIHDLEALEPETETTIE